MTTTALPHRTPRKHRAPELLCDYCDWPAAFISPETGAVVCDPFAHTILSPIGATPSWSSGMSTRSPMAWTCSAVRPCDHQDCARPGRANRWRPRRLVSVAANVAHSYGPPATTRRHDAGCGPGVGAVGRRDLAGVPVRRHRDPGPHPWPTARRWRVVRSAASPRRPGRRPVSYRHLSGLLAYDAEDDPSSASARSRSTASWSWPPVPSSPPPDRRRRRSPRDRDPPPPPRPVRRRPRGPGRPGRHRRCPELTTRALQSPLNCSIVPASPLPTTPHKPDGPSPATRSPALGISNGLATDLLAEIRKDEPALVPMPVPAVLTAPAHGHRPS